MKKNFLGNILNRLLFERKIKPKDLARKLNIPQPTIHRIVSGKSSHPHQRTLMPIAKYFNLSIEQLTGEDLLPENLFQPFPYEQKNKNWIEIPLISWDNLANLENNINTTPQNSININDNLSVACFATLMNDSSMEPQFLKGSILIFDPHKQCCDRSYALIKLEDSGMFIFRQILFDLDYKFLKPLNPELSALQMRLLNIKDKIIGLLVESRQIYNNS